MSDRMVAVWVVDAGISRAARPRERKVRTPQSNVPDNVREGEFAGSLTRVSRGGCFEAHFTESATENIPPRAQACGKGEKVR
jgi:hypothetical protein